MRTIKQLYYLQIILVIIAEANISILEDTLCVRLWSMVKLLWYIYQLQNNSRLMD